MESLYTELEHQMTRAIMVCVDYADLLALTLPYNKHHFHEIMVVTTPHDKMTKVVCEKHGAKVFETDAFYRDSAVFNKWRALEEGLDAFGRTGWMCIMDADVLWPKETGCWEQKFGHLYTPRRRMLEDIGFVVSKARHALAAGNTWNQICDNGLAIIEEARWNDHPRHRVDFEWSGYTQLFHAEDPVLGPAPWHQIDWTHAGGADSFFQAKWHGSKKQRPLWDVLHLGPAGKNWFGRATTLLDGSTPARAEIAGQMTSAVWRGRHGKSGDARFDGEKIKIPQA